MEDVNPVWSPDGQWIAFNSIRNRQEQIYVMHADGSDVKPVPNTGPLDMAVDWSPDGQYLLLISNREVNPEIFAIKPDGTALTNLSHHPANEYDAHWSPDGTKIVFSSDRDSESDSGVPQIYVMDSNGSNIIRLTDFPNGAYRPTWSPDGQQIAFSVIETQSGSNSRVNVYVMNADGTNSRSLTKGNGTNAPLEWSSDGGKILIRRLLYGAFQINIVNAEDGTDEKLPINASLAIWQPNKELSPAISLPAPKEEGIQPVIALINGTLIDGTGADPLSDAALIIENGRVVAVGKRTEIAIPADAQVIDVQGGTILPGFINSHVHGTDSYTLSVWAQNGVTTVCSLADRVGGMYKDWNEWVEQAGNENSSPYFFAFRDAVATHPHYARLIAAGPMVSVSDGYPRSIWGSGIDLAVISPQDARQKVETLLDGGADIVKISVESGPRLSIEEMQAIVDVAHEKGTIVTAHVGTTLFLEEAIAGDIDVAAHMSTDEWSGGLLSQMVTHDIYLVPTLSVNSTACGQAGTCLDNLRRFIEAGGKVALGNDYSNPGTELGMPMREIELMQLGGMTRMQIIVAATKNAAYACNQKDVGTLETGKIADILIVNGDPLQDIHALTDVTMVLHDGVIIRQTQTLP